MAAWGKPDNTFLSCSFSGVFYERSASLISSFIFFTLFSLFSFVILPPPLPYTPLVPIPVCLSAFHPQLLTVHHQGRSFPIGRTAHGMIVLSACHSRMLGTRGTRSVSVCIWPNNAIHMYMYVCMCVYLLHLSITLNKVNVASLLIMWLICKIDHDKRKFMNGADVLLRNLLSFFCPCSSAWWGCCRSW